MELSRRALTIVITDDSPDGQAVIDLAEEWHRLGLLQDFAVVTPCSITSPGRGPAHISARLVGADRQVDLMAHLGSRRRSLIRLVVLHQLTHEHSMAADLVAACNQIAGLVERAMPIRGTNGDADATRLLRINLLVPESDVAAQSVDILQPGWEINAVVSPEDRPDLDRLSVFVRAGSNLHGHALAAAASVGGFWSNVTEAVFDSHELDSTGGADDVLVLRCSTRIIVGDQRAELLTSSALEAVIGHRDGAVQHITWGYPSDRPAEVVDGVLSTLLRQQEWAPLERVRRPLEIRSVPMSHLIGDWLRFQATLPFAALGFLGGQAISAVERGVTSAVVGSESGVVGRILPVSPDEAGRRAAQRLTELSQSLEPDRLAEAADTWGQATPTAWRTLREVAIGQVDGSELPDGFVRLRRANIDEVLPPSYVVPAPPDPAAGRDTWAIRCVDVAAVAQVAAAIPEGPDADGAEAPGGLGDERLASDAPIPDDAPEEGSAEQDAAEAVTDEQGLETWVEERRESLFWKLASRVYEFRRRESARVSEARQSLADNADPPSTEQLERARSILVGCWIVTAIGLLATAGWLWNEHAESPVILWLPEGTWRRAIPVVLGLLMLSLVGGHHYFRSLRKYEWAVRRQMHDLAAASDEYVVASQQERRWALMYAGVLDWADILAQLLHRPWSSWSPGSRIVHEEFRGLPAAVAIARPTGEAATPAPDLVTTVVESLCHPGWLKEEFQRLLVRSPLNDPSSGTQWGDLAADMDLGLRPGGPRADLRRVAESGQAREAATAVVLDEVEKLIAAGRVAIPPLAVRRIDAYSAGELQSDRDFLLGTSKIRTPLASDLFSDRARVSGLGVPQTVSINDGAAHARSGESDVTGCDVSISARVDVSRTVQPAELSIFEASSHTAVFARTDRADEFN
ncbi:hypothetical protein [Nocardioides sp. LS1]|uniref:hypothetical protein n=1 Tax=Nocardioides sp. LS1 TaxID=1027620 RepID=UPI000F61F552|nr:hypothetical protein [Nocardioides sp. LS1]GCD91471.1 hypothetical protein NLS1_34770 [Nocardioides sp. LS1]